MPSNIYRLLNYYYYFFKRNCGHCLQSSNLGPQKNFLLQLYHDFILIYRTQLLYRFHINLVFFSSQLTVYYIKIMAKKKKGTALDFLFSSKCFETWRFTHDFLILPPSHFVCHVWKKNIIYCLVCLIKMYKFTKLPLNKFISFFFLKLFLMRQLKGCPN